MNKYQTVKNPSEALYIVSPCVRICKYNQANYCVNCKRHSDEITHWVNYSAVKMRRVIIRDLKE